MDQKSIEDTSNSPESSPNGKTFSELLQDIEENSAISRQHHSTDDFSFSSVDESPFIDCFNVPSTQPSEIKMESLESKTEDADTREAQLILQEATEKCPGSNDSTADSGVFSSPSAIIDDEELALDEDQLKKIHPKPDDSYMTLIAKAILASPDERAVLSDVYKFITRTFPYYRHTTGAWRNSIRHNLSVNECFVKAGRAPNGRGFYWTIHPACRQAFLEGDFNRRVARIAVQNCMKRSEDARLAGLQSLPTTPVHQYSRPQYIGYPTMSSTPIHGHSYQPTRSHPYFYQPSYSQQMEPSWQQYSDYNYNQGPYS